VATKSCTSQAHLASLVIKAFGLSVIDAGELRISKTTLGKRGGDRFLIYLPMNRNYLWKLLHNANAKVRVYIEVPEDVLKNISQEVEQMK
jgi:hypothetical protein